MTFQNFIGAIRSHVYRYWLHSVECIILKLLLKLGQRHIRCSACSEFYWFFYCPPCIKIGYGFCVDFGYSRHYIMLCACLISSSSSEFKIKSVFFRQKFIHQFNKFNDLISALSTFIVMYFFFNTNASFNVNEKPQNVT